MLNNHMDVLQLTNNKTIMKENLIRIVVVVSRKTHWLIMLFLFTSVKSTEGYFWMKSYGWKHPEVIV